MTVLTLGTRGSLLARTQSQWVADRLQEETGVRSELTVVVTSGDRFQDRPLPEIGGKGLFTRELDEALLSGEIDFAVHSLKDLPTQCVPGLSVLAVPEREDPRDVLVFPEGTGGTLETLPPGAVIGTSSLRRQAYVTAFRRDIVVRDVRGNIDTRLKKLDAGQYDGLILAAAGMRRLGLIRRSLQWLEPAAWLPAPAQGALGIVGRSDDIRVGPLLATLNHARTSAEVVAERTMLAALEGGCQVPIGALARAYDSKLRLRGCVASSDGRRLIRVDQTGRMDEPERLGELVARILLERGAQTILGSTASAQPNDLDNLDKGEVAHA